MTDLLWVRESEIAININVSDEHVIDQKGFWKYAFTPYAVFDTLHSYVDDDVRIGSDESEALIFARREQRIRLLQYIAPGQETLDGRYTAFINQGKGGRVIWRLEDLFWHMSSSEDSPMDFPAYLEKLYRIRRSFAWELACRS